MTTTKLTAAQVILQAAAKLPAEFTAADLIVACWQQEPAIFGLPGYEYPHSQRVLCEMASTKPSSPLMRGLIERVRPNVFRLTKLGKAEAFRLDDPVKVGQWYVAVAGWLAGEQFRMWRDNPDRPHVLPNDYRPPDAAKLLQIVQACQRHDIEHLTPAPCKSFAATPAPIHLSAVGELLDFCRVIEARFHRNGKRKAVAG